MRSVADFRQAEKEIFFQERSGTRHSFRINVGLFSLYSPQRFPSLLASADPIIFTEPVALSSFAEWVKACQYQNYTTTPDNVLDLLLLSTTYECHGVTADVRSALESKDMLVPKLLDLLDHDYATNAVEAQIRKDIGSFLTAKQDQLLRLPLSVIDRIVTSATVPTDDTLVAFLMKCLDKFGAAASSLFAAADFSKLTDEQRGRVDLGELKRAVGEGIFRQKQKVEDAKRRVAARGS